MDDPDSLPPLRNFARGDLGAPPGARLGGELAGSGTPADGFYSSRSMSPYMMSANQRGGAVLTQWASPGVGRRAQAGPKAKGDRGKGHPRADRKPSLGSRRSSVSETSGQPPACEPAGGQGENGLPVQGSRQRTASQCTSPDRTAAAGPPAEEASRRSANKVRFPMQRANPRPGSRGSEEAGDADGGGAAAEARRLEAALHFETGWLQRDEKRWTEKQRAIEASFTAISAAMQQHGRVRRVAEDPRLWQRGRTASIDPGLGLDGTLDLVSVKSQRDWKTRHRRRERRESCDAGKEQQVPARDKIKSMLRALRGSSAERLALEERVQRLTAAARAKARRDIVDANKTACFSQPQGPFPARPLSPEAAALQSTAGASTAEARHAAIRQKFDDLYLEYQRTIDSQLEADREAALMSRVRSPFQHMPAFSGGVVSPKSALPCSPRRNLAAISPFQHEARLQWVVRLWRVLAVHAAFAPLAVVRCRFRAPPQLNAKIKNSALLLQGWWRRNRELSTNHAQARARHVLQRWIYRCVLQRRVIKKPWGAMIILAFVKQYQKVMMIPRKVSLLLKAAITIQRNWRKLGVVRRARMEVAMLQAEREYLALVRRTDREVEHVQRKIADASLAGKERKRAPAGGGATPSPAQLAKRLEVLLARKRDLDTLTLDVIEAKIGLRISAVQDAYRSSLRAYNATHAEWKRQHDFIGKQNQSTQQVSLLVEKFRATVLEAKEKLHKPMDDVPAPSAADGSRRVTTMANPYASLGPPPVAPAMPLLLPKSEMQLLFSEGIAESDRLRREKVNRLYNPDTTRPSSHIQTRSRSLQERRESVASALAASVRPGS
ncbi:hypothetical protein DIPPA_27279 [Diplonema papillatum]|nr:hypothetical protein DIPPA_27279 [Diplonema papillatum]